MASELEVDECLGFAADAEEPDRHANRVIRRPSDPRGLRPELLCDTHNTALSFKDHQADNEKHVEPELELAYPLAAQSVRQQLMSDRAMERCAEDVKRVHEVVRAEEYPRKCHEAERSDDSHDVVKDRTLREADCLVEG